MATQRINLKLTAEQRDVIRQATGKKAEALELTAEELEARITPMLAGGKLPFGPVDGVGPIDG